MKNKQITKKQLKRIDTLYQNAIYNYIYKMDIDIVEYMEKEEKREYQKLHFLIDSLCVICGNPEIMFECPNIDCEFYETHEEKGECKCGKSLVIDKDYHKSC